MANDEIIATLHQEFAAQYQKARTAPTREEMIVEFDKAIIMLTDVPKAIERMKAEGRAA